MWIKRSDVFRKIKRKFLIDDKGKDKANKA